ncbi:MAG: T9SS type B sorting domain-containing protein [Flavobacteriaceae bacterium]|nr:T9SS type B sorting domain-containing protein [Flavobacteriaceae bacterium]
MYCTQIQGQSCIEVNARTVQGEETIQLSCDNNEIGNCIDLIVDYTPIKSTETYSYQAIPFNPPIGFDEGTSILNSFDVSGNIIDDKFSNIIDIGFEFCFYNEKYSQLVVGSNGIITFNLNNANAVCPAGIPGQNPNPFLISPSIFAPQQDFYFNTETNSDILYTVSGNAPCRQFILNYSNAQFYGCPDTSNIQVVLHEGTNLIEIFIADKPAGCAGNETQALLGIINENGDAGISPPLRNTSVWSTHHEAWKFTPSGISEPIITWTNASGEVIGNTAQISVCPTNDSSFYVTVEYENCINDFNAYTDVVPVNILPNYPVLSTRTIFVCDYQNDGVENLILATYNDEILFSNTAFFHISYHNTLADANNNSNPITNLVLTDTRNLYIRVASISNNQCFLIEAVSFQFTSALLDNLTLEICDNNNDGIELNYPIHALFATSLSATSIDSFGVFSSLMDAQNNTNFITTSNITPNTPFWVNLHLSATCQSVQGPFYIQFAEAPTLTELPVIQINTCDINSDNVEPFNWIQAISSQISIPPGLHITVHATYESAFQGIRPLNLVRNTFQEVFIRVRNQSGCFSVYPIQVNVEFTGIEVRNMHARICFDGTEDITYNLNDYYPLMINSAPEPYTVTFHHTYQEALTSQNPLSPIQTITEDGSLVYQDYFFRYQTSENCYAIKNFRIHLLHPQPANEIIQICDDNINSLEDVLLSSFNPKILGEIPGTVAYFNSQEDAENNSNRITNFTFTGQNTLWVRIVQHQCIGIAPVTFELVPPQELQEEFNFNVESSCDPDSPGVFINLNQFNHHFILESQIPEVVYFLNFDAATSTVSNPITDPTQYFVSENHSIYALINFPGDICALIAQVNLSMIPHIPLEFHFTELTACDFEHDLNESFDLASSIPLITADFENFTPSNFFITYYLTLENAENGVNPISQIFTPNQFEQPVFIKFQNRSTQCVDIAEILLHTYYSPKLLNTTFSVCDSNFDGLFELNLEDLIPYVNESDQEFNYTYYLSLEDAEEEINSISGIYESPVSDFQIWVKAEIFEGCSEIALVEITQNEQIEGLPQVLNYEICDENSDGIQSFDVMEIISEIQLTGAWDYNFFAGLIEVFSNTPLQNQFITINEDVGERIYLKITQNEKCPWFIEINFDLIPPPIASIENTSFCENETPIIIPILENPDGNYTYAWYDQNDILLSNEASLSGDLDAGNYYLVLGHTFIDCATMIPFEITFHNLEISPTEFEITACDINSNGILLFDLNQIQNQLNPNQSLLHFSTEANLTSILDSNLYQNIQAYQQTVYAIIEEGTRCPAFYPINLMVLQNPLIEIPHEISCNGSHVNLSPDILASSGPLNFEWWFENELISTQANISVNNPGTYTLSAYYTADNSCVFTFSTEVSEVSFDAILDDLIICIGQEIAWTPQLLHPEFDYNFTWLNAQGQIISNQMTLSGIWRAGQYTLIIQEVNSGCEISKTAEIQAFSIETSLTVFELIACETSTYGTAEFNLNSISTQFTNNEQIIGFYLNNNDQNPITQPQNFINTTLESQRIYVLLNIGEVCPRFYPVQLSVISQPEITFYNTFFCEKGSTDVLFEIDSNYSPSSFRWEYLGSVVSNSRDLNQVDQAGLYTLWITLDLPNVSCSFSYEVEIQSVSLPIIQSILINNNNVQIIAHHHNQVQYSTDLIHWQNSGNFNQLPGGIHTFYVRDVETGCISDPKSVMIIVVNNIITPNGDALNDSFVLDNLHIFQGGKAHLSIYDRFGKMVFEAISDHKIEWNGQFKGKPLPTGDYWYFLTLPDGQRYQGHITVKNK